MNYITVTTPENVEIEYRLAGAGSRLAAVIIDSMVQAVILAIVVILCVVVFFNSQVENIIGAQNKNYIIGIGIFVYLFIYLGYFIISEFVGKGQSLGKKLLHIRVIKENGQPASFIQILVRNVFRFFIDATGIGVICILFSKKCKRVGDMVASTIVVAESPNQIDLDLLEFDWEGTTLSSERTHPLTDEEYELIKDYFLRRDTFYGRGQLVLEHIQAYMARKFEADVSEMNEEMVHKILLQNKR